MQLNKTLILILLCGMISYAYVMITLARSFHCPQTKSTGDDAPVQQVAKQPSTLDETPEFLRPLSIVPHHCISPLRGIFDKIYSRGKWFKGKSLRQPSDFYSDADWPPKDIQQISASGQGSDRGKATITSMKVIIDTIIKYKVRSMIDIPCGDVNWIFDSLLTDTLPVYIGLDISLGVIEVNQQRFWHHRNKHFYFWDATLCELPKFRYVSSSSSSSGQELQSVDLVHVRDVIQHMTLEQGVAYFCNVFKSGPKVLITTTFPDSKVNHGAKEGGFYENNLQLEPFSFPPGADCVATHPEHEADLTCVYDLKEAWVQQFVATKC